MNIDSITNRMQKIETLLTIRNMLFKIRTGNLNLLYYEQEIVQRLEELECLLECDLKEDDNRIKTNTMFKLTKNLEE